VDPATELNGTTDAVIAKPEEVPTAPELPEEPETIPEDQQEQPEKKKVPKINTKEEETPIVYTQEDVPPPDQDATGKDIELEGKRQLTPQQAIDYANTQDDPKAAIDRLKKQRKLLDITDTYLLAQDTGLIS